MVTKPAADGVALGIYQDGAAARTVVLASRDEFDGPPKASNPGVAERTGLDGLAPSPACALTPGRFAAVHLGLCRLVARAAEHVETPFAFGFPASPHPLLAQGAHPPGPRPRPARGVRRRAGTRRRRRPRRFLPSSTIVRPPRKVRVYKRCHFCKKPLGEKFSLHTYVESVTRRRHGGLRRVGQSSPRARLPRGRASRSLLVSDARASLWSQCLDLRSATADDPSTEAVRSRGKSIDGRANEPRALRPQELTVEIDRLTYCRACVPLDRAGRSRTPQISPRCCRGDAARAGYE